MKKTKAEDQKKGKIIRLLHNNRFQRLFVGIVTIILAFFIIGNGAAPIRYKLSIGEASRYDITSPRDIENSMKTDEMAENVAEAVSPVMIRLGDVPIDILNSCDELFKKIETTKNSVSASLKGQGITTKSSNYNQKLELEQAIAAKKLKSIMTGYNITISDEQVKYLISKTGNDDLAELENLTRSVLSSLMKEEVTGENITEKIAAAESTLQKSGLTQDLKNIGGIIVKALVKPNSTIDYELTNAKKQEAYKNALENRQIISEGSRILSVGDTVTEDKLEVLKELNLLDDGRIDFVFAMGILALLILLAGLLVLYLRLFFKKILSDRNELIIIGIVVLLDLLLARVVKGYSVFIIPVFIAPMLISILIDMRLAIMINTLLALSVSMMTGWNIELLFLTIIAGSISSFLVSKTTQRGRLSVEGLIAGVAGALSVAFVGMLNKEGLSVVAINSSLVVLNGIISSIFTIGLLPFFESVFNIVTPLKLLELSNPTQPLLKRLLMEAPGTYHHSLMVGNLAESATEAIGGNSLLARVGAYYHDIGKLKRPHFFKENQMTDNPHNKMNASLSTLVITSHTDDGVEIATEYNLPVPIRDIIGQHHGTTLATYFFFKAQQTDKTESIKQEEYRYQGPRPKTREAAVVMLADSVEAAVRALNDKAEGKMEGLIRKVIKEKLDDSQLDLCDLTLKDLDLMAKAFLRVFSGYFHERDEYPEIKADKAEKSEKSSKTIEQKEKVEFLKSVGIEEPAADSGSDAATESVKPADGDKEDDGVREKDHQD